MRAFLKNRRGVAIVIALAGIGFIGLIIAALSATLFSEHTASLVHARSVEAYYLARAGTARAMQELNRDTNQADYLSEAWRVNEKAYDQVQLGRGTYHVSAVSPYTGNRVAGVVDEQSKLNLNTATRGMLRALPGVSEALADAIFARRANDRLFPAVEEVLGLDAAEPDLLTRRAEGAPAGIGSLLTVYGDGRVNVNTATPAVLDSLPGLARADVEAIVKFRNGKDAAPGTEDDGVFAKPAQLGSLLKMDKTLFRKLEPWIACRSTHFAIVSTGRVSGQRPLALEVRAVVERQDGGCRIVRFEELAPVVQKEKRR